jgi:hypothetical protein
VLIKRKLKIHGKRTTYTANQSWQVVGDQRIFFRSDWEYRYAKHLEKLKELKQILMWEHEPKVFWFLEIKRGTRSYLPDFRVTNNDGSQYWVEVKGYFDRKSITKIKRFYKYYPNEKLVIVDKNWFNNHWGS